MKKQLLLSIFSCLSIALMAQWSTDPMQNNQFCGLPGEDVIPKVASADNGRTYISWFSLESSHYNVRMQHVDVTGTPMWASGGILVSDHMTESWLTDYNLAVDKEACAILGYQDIRTGNNDIHVYRISPDGAFLWGPDGLTLSDNPAFEPYPVIAVPGDNQCVFAWQSEDTVKGIIRLQKIAPDSTRLWGPFGISYSSPDPQENYSYPFLVSSDNNSVILLFHKQTGGWMNPKYLYAQKFDVAGNPVWPADVPVMDIQGIPIIPSFFAVEDSAGGVVVCWHDTRAGFTQFEVYVQHISANGGLLFPANGVAVSSDPASIRMNPSLDYFPSTQETFVYFVLEDANQSQWGIAGQKLDAAGQLLWGQNMNVYIPLGMDQITDVNVRRAVDRVLVTYTHYNFGNFMDARVKAVLFDLDGNPVWTPVETVLCEVQSDKVHLEAGDFHANQWVLTWEDGRNGNPDIYAQNVRLNGGLGPDVTGVDPVRQPSLLPDVGCYPNPAMDRLQVKVNNPGGGPVNIVIRDLQGKMLRVLGEQVSFRGIHVFDWDRTTSGGTRVPAGVYLVECSSSAGSRCARIILQ